MSLKHCQLEVKLHSFYHRKELLVFDVLNFGVPCVEQVLGKMVDLNLLLSGSIPFHSEHVGFDTFCKFLHGNLFSTLFLIKQLLQVILEVDTHENTCFTSKDIFLLFNADGLEDVFTQFFPIHVLHFPELDEGSVLVSGNIVKVLVFLVEVNELSSNRERLSSNLDRIEHTKVFDLLESQFFDPVVSLFVSIRFDTSDEITLTTE